MPVKNTRISAIEVILFLLPASQLIEVQAIGRLFGTDIIVLLMLPFVILVDKSMWKEKYARSFLLFSAVWLFGAVSTDIYRETPFEDWSRGATKIIVFISSFIVIYSIAGRQIRRLVALTLGVAVFSIAKTLLFPTEAVADELWKFGYGWGVTIVVILLCSTNIVQNIAGRYCSLIPIAFTAFFSLIQNYRSFFAITLLSAIAAAIGIYNSTSTRGMAPTRIAAILVLFSVSALGTAQIYEISASSGLLGIEAQDKFYLQSENDLGLLLSGRTEILISTRAVLDSPILGHGSWAKDPKYGTILQSRLEKNGIAISFDSDSSDLIPTHSHILGSWVEAGIAGAVFWAYILTITVRGISLTFVGTSRMVPFYTFSLILLCWDILFSPFGAERRVITVIPICLAMLLAREARSNENRVCNFGREA